MTPSPEQKQHSIERMHEVAAQQQDTANVVPAYNRLRHDMGLIENGATVNEAGRLVLSEAQDAAMRNAEGDNFEPLSRRPEDFQREPTVGSKEDDSKPEHDFADNGEHELVEDAARSFEDVSEPDTLGSQKFMKNRFKTLRGVWSKAKKVVSKIGDKLAIEQDGYRLSPAENVKARFANFGVVWKAARARSNEERRAIMRENPVAKAAASRHYNRSDRWRRSDEENFDDRTLADMTKIAAYELTTMPVVRAAGLMALHGAAKIIEKATGSQTAGKIKNSASYRLALHEKGLHNPTIRKLSGVKWKDVKPTSEEPPIIDPKKTDLSNMDETMPVRIYHKSPFVDGEPRLITTTVGQLRKPFEDLGSQNHPREKVKAEAHTKFS